MRRARAPPDTARDPTYHLPVCLRVLLELGVARLQQTRVARLGRDALSALLARGEGGTERHQDALVLIQLPTQLLDALVPLVQLLLQTPDRLVPEPQELLQFDGVGHAAAVVVVRVYPSRHRGRRYIAIRPSEGVIRQGVTARHGTRDCATRVSTTTQQRRQQQQHCRYPQPSRSPRCQRPRGLTDWRRLNVVGRRESRASERASGPEVDSTRAFADSRPMVGHVT